MEYKKPDYIKYIHPAFKKYFSKKYFDGTSPYPPTIQEACKYVLYDVLEADLITSIQGAIPQMPISEDEAPMLDSEEGNGSEVFTLTYPGDYFKGFNYCYWQHLSMEQKVIMLYWLSEDITAELQITPLDFCFLTKIEAEGYHTSNDFIYQILINPNSLEYESSYDVVNTVAHELNHAQFSSVLQKKYMNKMNNDVYWSFDQTADTFENIYDYLMYFCQPIEITAETYAYDKVCKIFKRALEAGKTPSLTDLVCINGQKADLVNNGKLKEVIFGKNFEKHLDLYFLLQDYVNSLENPRLTIKKADEIAKDIEDINNEIAKEKAQFKKNYINYLSKQLIKVSTDESIK